MAKKKKVFQPVESKKNVVLKNVYAIVSDSENGVEYVTVGKHPEVFETESEAYVRISELNRKEKEMFGNITSKYQIIPYTIEGVV